LFSNTDHSTLDAQATLTVLVPSEYTAHPLGLSSFMIVDLILFHSGEVVLMVFLTAELFLNVLFLIVNELNILKTAHPTIAVLFSNVESLMLVED
jgi:hypothetical protein